MPDTTTLPLAEGGRASGGKTNWPVMIGVGGAGVLLLVLLMSSQKSGSSGTTAAGTSINAALGTIQEQNLNILGEVSKSEADLTGQLAGLNNNVIVGQQAMTWIGNQVAFAAAEQLTNPQDATARLNAAFDEWLKMGGNPGGDFAPKGGYQSLTGAANIVRTPADPTISNMILA